VIQDQQKQIEIRDLRVKATEDRLGDVTKERNDARQSADAWYKSPYLYLFLGLAVGVSAVKISN
jgi:hypothetical protein